MQWVVAFSPTHVLAAVVMQSVPLSYPRSWCLSAIAPRESRVFLDMQLVNCLAIKTRREGRVLNPPSAFLFLVSSRHTLQIVAVRLDEPRWEAREGTG
jgi:hypothetical protein